MKTTNATTWVPFIVVDIPTDIDRAEWQAIAKVIDDINLRLLDRRLTSKDAALDMAAVALSTSGCGACGRPIARRSDAQRARLGRIVRKIPDDGDDL